MNKICGCTLPLQVQMWAGSDPPPYKNPCEDCENHRIGDECYKPETIATVKRRYELLVKAGLITEI